MCSGTALMPWCEEACEVLFHQGQLMVSSFEVYFREEFNASDVQYSVLRHTCGTHWSFHETVRLSEIHCDAAANGLSVRVRLRHRT